MLKQLSQDFLAGIAVSKLDWKVIEAFLDEPDEEKALERQGEILEATVRHPSCVRFPPSRTRLRLFLKTLISKVEERRAEIRDDVLELHADLLDGRADGEEPSAHRTFVTLGDTLNITLKENVSIISDGTTGLHSWQAAFYLAERLLAEPQLVDDKRVVELGSGSGLVGLVCAKGCRPRSTTLTDFHPKVLDALRHNVRLNSAQTQVTVRPLDWLTFSQCDDGGGADGGLDADVVLASDVVYDPELIAALVATLGRLLRSDKSEALVACTVRNEDTLQQFLDQLESQRLVFDETGPGPALFSCDRSFPVRIYRIRSSC